MERNVETTLQSFRDELEQEVPEARAILGRLDGAQLQLRRAEPQSRAQPQSQAPRTWLLFYEPAQHLRERFDLAPEVLILLIPSRTAQARDITRAEDTIRRDLRLDRGLVLVIAQDHGAQDRLAHAARETGRVYVVVTFSEVQDASDPQVWLRETLLDRLGSSDLFAPSAPVFGWDFTGREGEMAALRKHLVGGRPVGLYGLRKIGKTSLLLFLRRQLITDSRPALESGEPAANVTVPIHLDLLEISFAQLDRVGFLRQLIKSTYRALADLSIAPESLGLQPDLHKTKELRRLNPGQIEKVGVETLELLIDWAEEAPGRRRIVLFIDEYERLLSNRDFPLADGVAIFEYLRGLVQAHHGVFNFLIAGLSRRLAGEPTLAGRQNPLFNFAVDFPLAGLSAQELRHLFRQIGRRLGLKFTHDAVRLIWEESGGHPFLARELGRLVDKAVPAGEREPAKSIERRFVDTLRDPFQADVENTMQEIARAVSELDEDALFALSYAVASPDDSGDTVGTLPPGVMEELRRLGILVQDGPGWHVRIACFSRWIQDNWERAAPTAVSA